MSFKRKKISKSLKKNQYLILFFSILIIIFAIIMGSNLGYYSPITNEQKKYLLSGDIVKNFKFETWDSKPISIGGVSQDRKMKFETTPVWRIGEDDIWLINIYTEGDNVYIRYKVAMINTVNMYTTVNLGECVDPYAKPSGTGEVVAEEVGYKDPNIETAVTDSYGLKKETEAFLVAKYQHFGLFGHHMFGWESYLRWTHYNFGNIKDWNNKHNDFDGDLVMSFDIAQSPLPNFRTHAGDTLTKNFDYIAVSSIAVNDNRFGLMNEQIPEIIGLTPREYEATQNTKTGYDTFGSTKKWKAGYDPNIQLKVNPTPNSFDGGVIPQSKGSSMHPRRKDGGMIWNPEAEQKSMRDCKFVYNIGSISPVVREYTATLSYLYQYYATVDEPFWQIGEKRDEDRQYSFTRPVALHVTNRYIQTEMRVVFDIFTSYKIDVGADGIEDYELDFPMEYYDLLTWITTVDGFGGGEQYTESIGLDWLLNPLGFSSGTLIFIVVIIIAILVLFIALRYGIKWYQARQQRKIIETALQRGQQPRRWRKGR